MKSSCLKKQARVPGGKTGLVGALVLGGEKGQFISFIETGPALFSSADRVLGGKCAKQINPSPNISILLNILASLNMIAKRCFLRSKHTPTN